MGSACSGEPPDEGKVEMLKEAQKGVIRRPPRSENQRIVHFHHTGFGPFVIVWTAPGGYEIEDVDTETYVASHHDGAVELTAQHRAGEEITITGMAMDNRGHHSALQGGFAASINNLAGAGMGADGRQSQNRDARAESSVVGKANCDLSILTYTGSSSSSEARGYILITLKSMGDQTVEFQKREMKAKMEEMKKQMEEANMAKMEHDAEKRGGMKTMLKSLHAHGHTPEEMKHIFEEEIEKEWMADKEFMLELMHMWGHSLEYASPPLQADREVVLAAVSEWGPAIRFASKELQEDEEILAAAEQHAAEQHNDQ